jgi:hypothetical protein
MTLRSKVTAILQERGEPITYRELTDLLWSVHPELKAHHFDLYKTEPKARQELRIQLGWLVKRFPQTFIATMSEGRVLVGMAVSDENELEDVEVEEEEDASGATSKPSVYWYTFPAYQAISGPYPIKIGRGADPQTRIRTQVTAMPEQPIVLGIHEHPDPSNLERALHSVLILRGKRKKDAPGTEWFMTTPAEIETLIKTVLG